MEFRKENFIALILILFFSGISWSFAEDNNNVTKKIVNETVYSIENKTISVFNQIKSIKYDYKLEDKDNYGRVYKAINDFDVHITSTHENSSISLAYREKCFVIYDTVYLDIFNKNGKNLTLLVEINNETTNSYNFSKEYIKFKFEFNENVKKLRFKVIENNTTIFDTGQLTVIHQNYVDWYKEQNTEYTKVEVGQLILSKIGYFLSGGILALVLAVIIARREKKKKESEILAGWQ